MRYKAKCWWQTGRNLHNLVAVGGAKEYISKLMKSSVIDAYLLILLLLY